MDHNGVQNSLGQDVALILVPREPDQDLIGRLETRYPGIEIRWLNTKIPTGLLKTEDMPIEIWNGVTILLAYQLPEPSLLPKLRFVQMSSAGADQCAQNPLYQNPRIPFCTANGAHPPQMAEWVIGTWLSFQHTFDKYRDFMKSETWEPAYHQNFEDSAGLRMGVLGYGAIGRQCANVAKAMGMDVIAFTMRERLTPESRKDDSYCVPGTGDPDGLIPSKWFHGTTKEEVNHFLSQDIDLLVICLPLTATTRNIISKEQFEILSKKKAFLSNVGRGGHVKTDDLIEALEKGLIRGAAIDVTDPEPLPKGHPLWKAPNLLITPHVSYVTTHYWPRIYDIFERNLESLSRDTPFINKVNKELHY